MPINTVFDFPSGLDLPAGVSVVSYDPTTRELVLSVENYLVEEGDPLVEFRINANVVENCNDLSSACSNIIQNQAFASYVGTINPDFTITDDPSLSSNTGCLLVPQATNFLADVDACEYRESAILCADSITITAADGYNSYSWSNDSSGSPEIATTQSLTVTQSGTYYVYNDAPAPCRSIIQIFDVITYGENQTNPIIPQADEVVVCPDDGKQLPNIYLCGLNDSQDLTSGITDGSVNAVWEILDEASCPDVVNSSCANEGNCTWNQVSNANDYTVSSGGQFRLTINYPGGCFNQFYFNVYQNVLNPTAVATDILCDSIGTITVNNVPSNYEYSLDGVTYQSSSVFNVASAGIYTVYIRQLNIPDPDRACVFTVENIRVRLRDFQFTATATQPLCNSDTGSINVSAQDGEPQYTFAIFESGVQLMEVGPINDNNYNFTGLGAGTYTVNVRTDDGCLESEEETIIVPSLLTVDPVLASPFIDCSIQATDSDGEPLFDEDGNPIFEESQGQININATGGTPPYSYYVNGSGPFSGNSYAFTSAGSYTIRVVDSNNCEATSGIDVEEILPPVYTVTASDIVCSDSGDTGTITFNVTNTYGSDLAYSIDNGVTFSNNNIFTNLAPGDYQALIRYTYGTSECTTLPEDLTIAIPDPLTGQAALTQDLTCDTTAAITVSNVAGGTPGYTYSIDGVNFQAGTVFTNLSDGNYVVVIQDSRGCTLSLPVIVIDALDPPTDLTFSNTPLTCPSNTTDITITSTVGGVAPLEYRISAPAAAATAFQTSTTFTNLDPITYTFEVRDANNCTYTENYGVTPLTAISANAQTQNDITCFGDSDGSILVTVAGTTTFEYTVNGGAPVVGSSPITLSGLAAGTYAIVIRDTNTTCTASTSAAIAAPPSALALSVNESPITCIADGSVELTATGGWGGYSYSLTQPDASVLGAQASGIFTGLTLPGTYTATVSDTNGCVETDTFTLSAPTDVAATIDASSDFCYTPADGATLVVNVTAGQAPFEFSLNGGAYQTDNEFANLPPGTYTITVRDAYGCTLPLASQVIEPQLTIVTQLTKELDCTSNSDAIIEVTTAGGTTPYTYTLSYNSGSFDPVTLVAGTPPAYNANASGTYQFRVTDAQGCIAESSVTTVAVLTSPTVTATPTDPLCFNGTDGQVQLNGSGGSGGYLFSFDGGSFGAQSLFTGLPSGTYTYQVQDSNECTSAVLSITLNNPTELVAAATIPANTTCSSTTVITVTATGGTPSYTYSFEGGSYSSSNTYTVNNTTTTQTITYSVRDANGCIDTDTIDIPPYDPVTALNITNSNAITCDDNTTDVAVTPTGGIAPFTYEITAPASATTNTTGVTTGIFTGLTSGNYTFEVTDANGCSFTASHTIAPVRPIQIAFAKADEQCFIANDGQAVFTITDVSSVGNYDFTLTPATGTVTTAGNEVTVTNLAPGSYNFTVEDRTTGCTDNGSFTIDAATQITFTATASNVNCNETISNITFTAGPSGGTPGYTYAYTTLGASSPAVTAFGNATTVDTSTLTTDITVWVKDANDCTVSQDINIVTDPTPTVTLAVDDQCGTTGNSFTITATPSPGVAPYVYSIDGGTTFQTSPTFTITPGTYTVTVRDTNGCTDTSNSVTVSPQLTLTAVLDKDITCSLPEEGQITLTATGGDGSYTYESSTDGGTSYTAMGTNVLNTLTPGSYTFRVTDTNGCTAVTTAPIDLTTPTDPDITVAQTAFINCNAEETAAISITPNTTVGQAPYVYEVINTTTGTNYGTQTSGLAAGSYTVTVTDAKGCTEVENITIAQPDPIVVNNTTVPITCDASGVSQGSIIIDSVTGGTAPYNYYVDGTNGYDEEELNNTGTTSTTFDVVDFGLYQINVVDANGCSVLIQDVLVASPPDDLVIDVTTPTADCSTGGEATVTVSTTLASSGPFYFDIYDGTIPPPPPGGTWQLETSPGSITFTGLTPGVTYTFIVFDDTTKCSYFETAQAPIPTNSTLTTTAESSNNITCTGSTDGNVSFTVNNPEATDINVSYEIFNAQSLATTGVTGTGTVPAGSSLPVTNLGPLGFGNYYVLIRETTGPNAGCSIVTAPFSITQSANLLNVTASVSRNENCNELGVISAVAADGTAPYQYQILPNTAPAPVATDAAWANANTFNVAAGDYIVYALDAYGCIQNDPVSLIRDAEPTINTPAAQCFTGSPITITITGTVTIGSPSYSFEGSAFSANADYEITSPGSYTLAIQDGNGCSATTTYVVNDQVTLIPTLTKEEDCTASPGAEITLTAGGGDATYTYEVSTSAGGPYVASSNPYTVPVTGASTTYFFRVTDGAGCTAINSITVDPPAPITFNPVPTAVSCNGGSDGIITVNVTGGVGPFGYQIDGTPATPQTSNIFTGLTQGTYNITVTDSYSCTITQSVTVGEPTVLTATAVAPPTTTCDVATTITVTASNGTPYGTSPSEFYYYSFEGNGFTTDNTYVVNDDGTGTSQTITYRVRDANNCIFTDTVIIAPLDPPTDLSFNATIATCDTPTSDVTITATDGVGALTYDIIVPSGFANTSGDASGIYTGLPVGTYTFEVTDARGCTYQEQFTVPAIENIEAIGQLVNDVSCNAGNDGAVNFIVSNFTGTYSYTVSNGDSGSGVSASTISVTGLTVGNYTINVTDDATGCPATASIAVAEPTVVVLSPDTNINATCTEDAQVTVSATGGTPPYEYSFVESGDPAGTFTSSNTAALDPATSTSWDVYVQDNNNCQDMITVTIATDPLPTGFGFAATSQCPDASGEYELVVTPGSGIAPFTYSIGNGYQTGTTFTVNAPGTYIVTIRDGNGCETQLTETILPALQVNAAIVVLPSCTDNDGEIEVTAAGGSSSYEFTISPDPNGVGSTTSTVFTGLPAGTYTVTTTDTGTLCTVSRQVTLEAPTPVQFTEAHTDVSCFGGSDGTITLSLNAGFDDNPLYTYEITGPAGSERPAQSSNVFTGLSANIYTVQVNSGRGCFATQDIEIEDPLLLEAFATADTFNCAADNSTNTVTLTITENGGTPPYRYSIDGTNYFSSNIFQISDTGSPQSITAHVEDANGCPATDSITIQPLNAITDVAFNTIAAIDCNGTGQVELVVTGGSGNFEFVLLPGGTPQASTIFDITAPGTYYFRVNDLDTGCFFLTAPFVVAPFDIIEAQLSTLNDVDCFENASGTLSLNVTNYTGSYTYEVLDSTGALTGISGTGTTTVNPLIITGVNGGNYTVTVTATDSPFCTTVSNSSAVETPVSPVAVVATETYNVTCDNNQGIITAVGSGGTPPYEFELTGPVTVNFSPTATFTDLVAGSYTVTVRDANDCEETDTVLLEVPDPIAATFTESTTQVACFGDQTATITVTNVTGGQGADYNYTLNRISPNPSTFGPQSSNVFSNLGAGVYTITIGDTYNCATTSRFIEITEPEQVIASIRISSRQTCLTDAVLELSATGGTGVYTYDDSPDFSSPLGTFTDQVPATISVTDGSYTYYVRDENGCGSSTPAVINVEPLIELDVELSSDNPNILCFGEATGSITATAVGGLGNYVYNLRDASGTTIATTQDSPAEFRNLPAGSYDVLVESGDCLVTSRTITFVQPDAALDASDYILTEITCNGANDGMLTINPTGGTPPYQYSMNPPNFQQTGGGNVFENLAVGLYEVLVEDSNGCFVRFPIDVVEPDSLDPVLIDGSIIPETCLGDQDGSFMIEISGGTLPYSYSLDVPEGPFTQGDPLQTEFTFSGLSGGAHVVYIVDANGCENQVDVDFPITPNLNPSVEVVYDCNDNEPGNTVIVTVEGVGDFTPDFTLVTYELDNSGVYQTVNEFVNVAPGSHQINVYYNGTVCDPFTTEVFFIEDIQPLTLTLTEGNLNEIVATASGGFGNYEFELDGVYMGTTNTFVISETRAYAVRVTDAQGCTVLIENRTFEFVDVCIPNYFTPSGRNDTWSPGCADNYPNLETQIFDRYGRVIVTMRLGESWNGKYNGKELPTGDYWYIVKLGPEGNNREFVGHFTLYR